MPADLIRHDCLSYAAASNSAADVWRLTGNGQEQAFETSGRVRINDARALVAAAVAGCGIMFGPKIVLDDEIAAGRLVRVLPDFDGLSRPVTLIHAANRQPTPKLKSFVEWVVGLLQSRL